MGQAFAGPKQPNEKRATLNKEAPAPEKFPLAGHEMLHSASAERVCDGAKLLDTISVPQSPAEPSDATMVEAPAFHLGGVDFARMGYPRTYTQSSFFAGMWHVMQSVL